MRLDKVLIDRNLCESRVEAQELISYGKVLLNGKVCLKQTTLVKEEDKIEVTERRVFVSRGGEKLLGVLINVFNDKEKASKIITNCNVLDVGSSTGGFTDCLLQFGATHVDAIDVGTNQLHLSLRENKKVSLFENTDIRNFESDKEYDFIVADLSFISLLSVLKDLIKLGAKNKTKYILLIKPQFEVGKGNTKKGIVKDESLVREVLEKIKNECENFGLEEIKIFPCHIKGGDGNQEYFLCAEM